MKTAKVDEWCNEYNRKVLGKGVRGKYDDEYKRGTNLSLLNPNCAAAFPNEASVNAALRGLLSVAKYISP
jgi:hypothetical protein